MMTAGEREILQGIVDAIKDLSKRLDALHAAFDELTLVPPTEEELRDAVPDPMEQHMNFVASARRNYEARNPGGTNA